MMNPVHMNSVKFELFVDSADQQRGLTDLERVRNKRRGDQTNWLMEHSKKNMTYCARHSIADQKRRSHLNFVGEVTDDQERAGADKVHRYGPNRKAISAQRTLGLDGKNEQQLGMNGRCNSHGFDYARHEGTYQSNNELW